VSAVRVATMSAMGASALRCTQPMRVTCTHCPLLSGDARLSPNPCESSATNGPAGAARRFSLGARVTSKSKSGRSLGPTDVEKIQPSSKTCIQSLRVAPAGRMAPRASLATRRPATS